MTQQAWTQQVGSLRRHVERATAEAEMLAGMNRGAALELLNGQRNRREILVLLASRPATGMNTHEVADETGLSMEGARGHLGKLRRDGLVELRSGKGPWIWKITPKGQIEAN